MIGSSARAARARWDSGDACGQRVGKRVDEQVDVRVDEHVDERVDERVDEHVVEHVNERTDQCVGEAVGKVVGNDVGGDADERVFRRGTWRLDDSAQTGRTIRTGRADLRGRPGCPSARSG